MKTNQELRLELDLIGQEMFNLFQRVFPSYHCEKDMDQFVETKDRFNATLSQLANHEHAFNRLIADNRIKEIKAENERDFVMEIGTVLLSRSDDYGILAVVFKDGEIWVVKEFSFKAEEELDQPKQERQTGLLN